MTSKIIKILIVLVLLSWAYHFIKSENKKSKAVLETEIVDVTLMNKEDLELNLFFTRPELLLSEESFATETLNSELPEEFQIEYIYLDDNLCDAARIPHLCKTSYNANEVHQLKVSYKDGIFFDKEIKIPSPKELEKIEVISAEQVKTSKGLNFKIGFKDNGADQFLIAVENCKEYKGDGINPCFEGKDYVLIRLENGLIQFADQGKNSPELTVVNNVIEINDDKFSFKTDGDLEYTISSYSSEVSENGTKLYSKTGYGPVFVD